LSLGDTGADGSVSVRLYYKPMVLLIWLGAVVMAMGGALSLSDRRLRVGAPKPAARVEITVALRFCHPAFLVRYCGSRAGGAAGRSFE
jgi:hypothetical protein